MALPALGPAFPPSASVSRFPRPTHQSCPFTPSPPCTSDGAPLHYYNRRIRKPKVFCFYTEYSSLPHSPSCAPWRLRICCPPWASSRPSPPPAAAAPLRRPQPAARRAARAPAAAALSSSSRWRTTPSRPARAGARPWTSRHGEGALGQKERSTPVSRRALRGHSVHEDHRSEGRVGTRMECGRGVPLWQHGVWLMNIHVYICMCILMGRAALATCRG